MSQWESSLVDQESGWQIVRPEVDTSGGQKHYLLEDGSILAQGYAPPTLTSNFKAEVELQHLSLLYDSNCSTTPTCREVDLDVLHLDFVSCRRFKAVVAPLSNPQKQTELKFIHATSDVNPQERNTGKNFG